jgi:hypothetical protein
VTKEEDDTISLQTTGFASVRGVQIPSANLLTTTSQEISFKPEQLALKLEKLTTTPPPPLESPPYPSKHSMNRHVKKSSDAASCPPTEMKLHEGGDTWEDVEELDKDWHISMDGIPPIS